MQYYIQMKPVTIVLRVGRVIFLRKDEDTEDRACPMRRNAVSVKRNKTNKLSVGLQRRVPCCDDFGR
jgi:hypothetical protein